MKRSLALIAAQKRYYMKNKTAIHKKIAQTAKNKYNDIEREKKREYYIEKKNFEKLPDYFTDSFSKLFRES